MNEIDLKLGQLLKLERERRQLALTAVSEELKISEENLVFIETGRRDALPGDLYFNLFAKSYAELLGVDYARTVEAIKDELGIEVNGAAATEPDKPTRTEAAAEKERPDGDEAESDEHTERAAFKRLLPWLLGVVGLFVVVLAVVLIFFNSGPEPTAEEDAAVQTTEAKAEVQEPDRAASEYANYDWNTPDYQSPPPLTLVLVAREASWATVLADGDTAVFQTLRPWREYRAEAEYRLVVSLAHPRLVDVKLNGQAVDLRDPQSRRISRVEVNQANVAQLLSRPEPEPADTQVARPASPAVQPAVVEPPVADSTEGANEET